uniref:Uncharacterized protein n=1 Tax=Tanacetum cinerariifolium TaxID=118510 RepID=A0A699HEN0_TANCI|nr:hypothetical protein [Tanacetum cinerariifolium]
MKDIAIKELRKKLEVAQKEKDGFQLTIEKLENAFKSLNKLIDCQIIDNRKKGLGLDEIISELAVETLNAKTSEEVPKSKNEFTGMLDSGCLRHIRGNMSYLTVYKEIDGGYVSFRGNPKGGKITGPNQVQIGEGLTQPTDTQHTSTFDMPPPKPKRTQKPRQPKRKTTKVPQPSESTDIATDEGRIDEIDADEDIALVSTHDDVSTQDNIVQDEGIKYVGKEEVVEVVTTAKMLINTVVDASQVTTAIADILVYATKTIVTTIPTITAESTKTNVKVTQVPKRKGVMIQEPEETTTTKIASSQQPQVQDKAWDDVQAKIKVDYQLAQRLQAEEQEQLTDAEKEKMFMKLLEKRRKFFAAKRTKEKRNRPPTKAKQRTMKRINTFSNFRTELVEESTKKVEADTTQESSSKRTEDYLEQERSKKQKIENDKESA